MQLNSFALTHILTGVCLFVGWLLNVPATGLCISGTDLLRQFTCCHTEIEVADPAFYLTQSQYTDTGPTSPSADPRTPGAWQGSHWKCQFFSHWYDSTPKKSRRKRDSNPGTSAHEADALTTRPTRRSLTREIVLSYFLGDKIFGQPLLVGCPVSRRLLSL